MVKGQYGGSRSDIWSSGVAVFSMLTKLCFASLMSEQAFWNSFFGPIVVFGSWQNKDLGPF